MSAWHYSALIRAAGIALAEHLGFAIAYVLASARVVVINTGYSAAILLQRWLSVVVGVVLTAIYGVLFTFLEAEDLALLGGTMLLVVALTVTMYFTRGIHRADEGRVCTDEQRAP